MKKQVAIINYNTPELVETAIYSLRKHGGENYEVTVFDNSSPMKDKEGNTEPARPFRIKMEGVKVIDNTQGQVIDFDKALAAFPHKNRQIGCAEFNEFGSVKHIMTVQKLWELLPDGFVLMDSDILIKKNIDEFFRPEYSVVAYVQKRQSNHHIPIGRVLPMLCWMNVPMFRREGVSYFDPNRCWAIHSEDYNDRNNWYDTGASLLEDILTHRPRLKGLHIDIRDFVEHLGSGSWRNNSIKRQSEWLNRHKALWEPTPRMRGEKKIAVCAIGRNEDRYAREWVEHYKKLGVAKLFIYDNYLTGETPLAEVLADYVKMGFVEITDVHDKPEAQCACYEHCYKQHGGDYAWIGFLDFDEYLRWNGRKKIESMFQPYTEGDVLMVNWRLMTDGGNVRYDDRPLAVRFKQPMKDDVPIRNTCPENDYAKCFVRGGLGNVTFGKNPHCPNNVKHFINTRGERIKPVSITDGHDHTIMRIDHYWTKTAEEWRDKLRRGFCSGKAYTDNILKHQEEMFFAVNERTLEKEAVLREM